MEDENSSNNNASNDTSLKVAVDTDVPMTKSTDRITLPRMTKYEKAHIIGVRASQLSAGATPFIDIENETNPLTIATKELYEKKIPFIVRRKLPDQTYEDWKIEELKIPGLDFY